MSTLALAAISGTAFAADLPSRRAPPVYVPPPIPVFSWTGFYIGGQVGYAFGRDGVVQTGVVGAGPARAFNDGFSNGIIGGAHVGYNWQLGNAVPVLGGIAGGFGGGGLVFGVEGDVDGSDYRGAATFPGAVPLTETNRVQIEGSARGRLGIAVDRALFYATGGAAFAQFVNTYASPALGYQSLSHTRTGWTVGGGVEYAITTQWSLRAEYRYADFGTYTETPAGFGFNASHKMVQERAQVGFSYKFDNPVAAPVVARY